MGVGGSLGPGARMWTPLFEQQRRLERAGGLSVRNAAAALPCDGGLELGVSGGKEKLLRWRPGRHVPCYRK